MSFISYNDVQTSLIGTSFLDGLAVGQTHVRGTGPYTIYRSALFFDTSVLPDGATITSAVLSLYYFFDGFMPDRDFNVVVVDGAAVDDTVSLEDYGDLGASMVNGRSLDTFDLSTISKRVYIPLEAAGIGWIDTSGVTKLGLRSSYDIAGTPPDEGQVNTVLFWGAGFGP